MANSKKELKVLYKNLNELQENPKNSRVHSEKQVAQIAKSIDSFGFNNPVLIDQNGVIIAGHGRYLAAKELELEEIPTVCLSHMTPDQIRAYIIADNKLSENAGWDKDILKIAVCERHNYTNHKGVGYIKGIGLKSGAIASSVRLAENSFVSFPLLRTSHRTQSSGYVALFLLSAIFTE